MSETKEMLFHRSSPRNYLPLAEMPGIDRVVIAQLLGVRLQSDLGRRKHSEYIMQICYQQFYLLSELKKTSLPQNQLQQHTLEATIVSRILCVAPA